MRRVVTPTRVVPVGLVLILLLVGPTPAGLAEAQGFNLSQIAVVGDAAAGTGGGSYVVNDFQAQYFGPPSINVAGETSFHAYVTGGTSSTGIFVDMGGPDRVAALSGETAPGTGGGTYGAFDQRSAINANSQVAFHVVSIVGGSASAGIFTDSGGTDSAVVLRGQTAPGTGGGTYSSFYGVKTGGPDLIAFGSRLSGGTSTKGIFLSDSGVQTAIALVGQTAPGTGGATYSDFFVHSLNSGGMIAFNARLSNPNGYGLFLYEEGSVSPIAVTGQTAPGTGGGTFFQVGSLDINDLGEIAFKVSISSGTTTQGIFLYSGGVITAALLSGQPAPDTGGGTILTMDELAMNDAGDICFTTSIAGGTGGEGVFFLDRSSGEIGQVAIAGQEAPGLGGVTFSHFGSGIDLNNLDQVAFAASLSDISHGLFRATSITASTSSPALSAPGLALFCILFLAMGHLIFRVRATL